MEAITSPTVLETERLYLRIYTAEAYKNIIFNAGTDEICNLFCIEETTIENEKERCEKGFDTCNITALRFFLVDKATGKTIGDCAFHTWYYKHNRAEIGYTMRDESYKRKGLMKEALRRIVQYAFEDMGMNRIEALTGTTNEASQRLLKHLGFSYEGHLKQHYFRNGIYEDSIFFALLKDEYRLEGK